MQVTLHYLYQHLLRETDKTTDILISWLELEPENFLLWYRRSSDLSSQ
jgi:hypothetical protein